MNTRTYAQEAILNDIKVKGNRSDFQDYSEHSDYSDYSDLGYVDYGDSSADWT